jgi:hypothetical protein
MWYRTFKLVEREFDGRLRVLWRPSSDKSSREQPLASDKRATAGLLKKSDEGAHTETT